MSISPMPRRRATDVSLPFEDAPLPKSSILTRISAFLFLCTVVLGVVFVGRHVYWAVTDSFVAPLILSPDNDVVLAHKQKVVELEVQRSIAQAALEGVEVDSAAAGAAAQQLIDLQALTTDSMRFTHQLNWSQASAGSADLATLQAQQSLLEEIKQRQQAMTDRAKESFRAALITQGEYEKEVQALRQSELNLLENRRAMARAQAMVGQVRLGGKASGERGNPVMPELAMRQTQIAQMQLELIRIQSEQRAKMAEKKSLQEKIAKLDELESQLRSRPLFRAMEKSLHAAFVPYTQIEDVVEKAHVYQCVWGIFRCRKVGTVSEIIPGEVSMADPWGNPARGQFILLDLEDAKAATAKVLRIRPAKSGE